MTEANDPGLEHSHAVDSATRSSEQYAEVPAPVSEADGLFDAPEPSSESVYIGGDPSTRFAAESLEEVARGIRAGEIVVPPMDPAADQRAVLAAVLAVLLAPRR